MRQEQASCLLLEVDDDDEKYFILTFMQKNHLVLHCSQVICLISIKRFKQHLHMIKIYNPNFVVSVIFRFWVFLVTFTHSHQSLKCDFRIQGTSKHKISVLKIWPKNSVFSVPYRLKIAKKVIFRIHRITSYRYFLRMILVLED